MVELRHEKSCGGLHEEDVEGPASEMEGLERALAGIMASVPLV